MAGAQSSISVRVGTETPPRAQRQRQTAQAWAPSTLAYQKRGCGKQGVAGSGTGGGRERAERDPKERGEEGGKKERAPRTPSTLAFTGPFKRPCRDLYDGHSRTCDAFFFWMRLYRLQEQPTVQYNSTIQQYDTAVRYNRTWPGSNSVTMQRRPRA